MRGFPQVFFGNFGMSCHGCQGFCGFDQHDIGPVAVNSQRDGNPGCHPQNLIGSGYLGQQLHGALDAMYFILLFIFPFFNKLFRIVFVLQTAFDNFGPFVQVLFACYVNRKGKTVQQLGPDVAFFRVHGANQREAGGMGVGDAFPFYRVDTHGRGVQQYVYYVIIQKIDFVYIQNVPVGVCQNTGLKGTFPFFDSGFNVQSSHDTVFRGTDRKFHYLHGKFFRFRRCVVIFFVAFIAPVGFIVGVVVELAAFDAQARWKQISKGAHGSGLGCAFFTLDQYAAQTRIHHVQYQRFFHFFLPDNGGKWKGSLSFHNRIVLP